jgi:hypothetical protein
VLWVNSRGFTNRIASTWFAKLAKHRLQRGVFPSVLACRKLIHYFIATHNRDPKPFILASRSQGHHRRRKERVPSVRFDPLDL